MGVSIGSGVAFGIGPPGSTGAGIPSGATPYTIQYLVVGGGGSGSAVTAGGGGGGGGVLHGCTTINPGTTYTIQIGTGGPVGCGAPGNASNISGSGFSTINAPGGGGGGSPTNNSQAGGSGGGGYGTGPGGLATGSPGPGVIGTYGYPGSAGTTAGGGLGGGGGGASGAGGSVTPGCRAAPGGAGYAWPLLSAAQPTGVGAFAGGGGGAGNPGLSAGFAGAGGPLGPSGASNGTFNGSLQANAIVNSGSGGGGSVTLGGAGGPGIVFVAVPNSAYPSVTGSGYTTLTPPAAPGMTILRFTAPGTYTA